MNIPWTEKYRPKRISEIIDNENAKNIVISWLKDFFRKKTKKKAVLLYGPPGVGKTTLAYALANDFNLEIIEVNASDTRNAITLKKVIGNAVSESSLFGKKGKIILMDEVDGINPSQDSGGINEIIKLIENTRIPIILTANNPWDPKLRKLRNRCVLVEVKKLSVWDAVKLLKKICEKEGIVADNKVLREMAKRSAGDLRAAINDLQAIAGARKKISKESLNMLGIRSRQLNMFEIVRNIFLSKKPEQAKAVLMQPSLDFNLLLQWINENIPYQYQESNEAIAEAFNNLSKADIYLGRIKKSQDWSLLSYALDLMTAGVALVPHKPKFRFVKYSFPQKLKLMFVSKERRGRRNRVLASIAKKCHTSKKVANTDILPYVLFIYKNNKKAGQKIIKWLRIDEGIFQEIS